MKEYTNQELERLKALHEKFAQGIEPLSQKESVELLAYLNDTVQRQAEAQVGVLAAVNFEKAIKQVFDTHIKQGLTVSQAAGVMSLVKTEIEMSFFLRTGSFNNVIRETVFSTKVQGS